jgi:hypothetical protein
MDFWGHRRINKSGASLYSKDYPDFTPSCHADPFFSRKYTTPHKTNPTGSSARSLLSHLGFHQRLKFQSFDKTQSEACLPEFHDR